MMTTNLKWKIDEGRLRKAEDAAEEILGYTSGLKLPIDPWAISKSEFPLLKVHLDDFGSSFDGQLEYHQKKNRFLLFLNNRYDQGYSGQLKHHPRTRFSLGHELGHYFLPKHRDYLMGSGSVHRSRSEFESDAIVEREADAFAASLLMPKRLFRPKVNQSPLTALRLEELRRDFDVSITASAIRAIRLSDFPCAIACMRNDILQWMFVSKALPQAGIYPKPIGSRIPDSTILRRDRDVSDWFRYFGDGISQIWLEQSYVIEIPKRKHLVLLAIDERDLG